MAASVLADGRGACTTSPEQQFDAAHADELPQAVERPELRTAMGILKMLPQNDLERELYQGRLKAERDMQTLETLREQWQQRYEAADREREEAIRERDAAIRERDAAIRERDVAIRELRHELIAHINLCQRLFRRPIPGSDELLGCSMEELRERAERLRRELTQGIDAALNNPRQRMRWRACVERCSNPGG